ncbi:MAG: replication factor C large subunit [Nanoarchaeota archaeon]|nr:replication factor C large subunit [Nanoarchaeota archaeon]
MTKETPWVEKYRPNYFSEIKGQEVAVQKIKDFVKHLNLKGEHLTSRALGPLLRKGIVKNTIILYGPPGTGKTILAHVAAKETQSEIFELNASDLRNKSNLQEILKPAIEQKSLIEENKIILVDEVDGISKVDWGGLTELINLVSSTKIPIIITANDIWDRKFNPLRSKSELVNVKEIDYRTIKEILLNILKKEKLFLDEDFVTKIATKSKGDVRAAINDLQAVSKLKDPSEILLDERNKETDIFKALRTIFKEKPTEDMLRIFDQVNLSFDEIILWVEENIPSEYKGEELERAMDLLSKVDVFKGRIYKQQYWRFLVYENIFLSYGISSSKRGTKTGFTSYKKPDRILKIWLNNQRTAKKKSIAKKYARYVHVGEKRAMQEFPLLKNIFKNKKVQNELRFNEEEIEYIMNGKH